MIRSILLGSGATPRALKLGLVAVMVALLMLLVVAAKPAHAVSTFTVNQTGDQADASLSDNVCDADLSLFRSQCTLRAAIQEANDTPGADQIHFNIAGTGVKTISPGSALPPTIDRVTIDGYTQPGASENTLKKGTNAVLRIELSGANAGAGANGLTINSGSTTVRGLVINRFTRGISMGGAGSNSVSGNRIEGNFIGTDPSGQVDLGNASDGILVFRTALSTIGGTSRAARNLISGNNNEGVDLGVSVIGNGIEGNLIGTDASGTQDLGNTGTGVHIGASGATVTDNTVGGATSSAANVIAFNNIGVFVFDALDGPLPGNDVLRNSILRNSVFSNGILGIDLDPGGPTANDPGDADVGPNDLQNKPSVTSATTAAGSTTIGGDLDSTPNTTFKVQFFSNPAGIDEGKKFIGQKSVTTDSNGLRSFTFSPNKAVEAGQQITATATGPEGTSEFSAPKTVT